MANIYIKDYLVQKLLSGHTDTHTGLTDPPEPLKRWLCNDIMTTTGTSKLAVRATEKVTTKITAMTEKSENGYQYIKSKSSQLT